MNGSDADPDFSEEDALVELGESEPDEGEHLSRRSREYWETRLGGTRASLESRRSSSRLIDSGFHAYERNRRIPVSLLAGALAARIVIYFIPFTVLAVVATGVYAGASNTDLIGAAKEAGMAGLLAEAVEDSAQASTGFKTVTLIGMILVTIWTADSLAKLVRRIHGLVWVMPRQRPEHRWMLPLTVLGLSIASVVSSWTGANASDWDPAIRAGELLLEVALVAGIWLVLSHYLPHDPEARSWRHLLPGALLVGLGVIGMKAAMVLYLAPRAVALAERYDEVAVAIVMLTWGYWIAFIIVFSAVLNASLFQSRLQRSSTT